MHRYAPGTDRVAANINPLQYSAREAGIAISAGHLCPGAHP